MQYESFRVHFWQQIPDARNAYETIVGLLIQGIDPRTCNLDMNNNTIPNIKACFEKGKLNLRKGSLFLWKDIQSHIPSQIQIDIKSSREFLIWLRSFDFNKYKTNRIRHYFWNHNLLFRNGRM